MERIICYTPEQVAQLQTYISETFGGGEDDLVGHEIESEYVHTDVQIIATKDNDLCFVTTGMGARKMISPCPDFRRAELLMYTSKEIAPTSKEAFIIVSELQRLSKFPFRNNTWLFHSHTLPASEPFRQTFGFDAFALIWVETAEQIEGIGEIPFLQLIPIYADERQWIMDTDTFEGYMLLDGVFGYRVQYADSKREKYIPDAKTIDELKDFLKNEQENT